MPWDPFLMKKLLKSGICGFMNSTLMHCLLQKSQHLQLLFNEQYMNSNHVSPKRVIKKKKKNKNAKRRRGFKTQMWIQTYTKISNPYSPRLNFTDSRMQNRDFAIGFTHFKLNLSNNTSRI